MVDAGCYWLENTVRVNSGHGCGQRSQIEHAAVQLYQHAYVQGWWVEMWSKLTRHSHHLLNLQSVLAEGKAVDGHEGGIQIIPIRQILGSECRTEGSFDTQFHPLQEHDRDRWLQVATARLAGTPLPPVQLIQVGQNYFVRDGHHRISVAQALGEEYIEAEVTVWDVAGTG